MASARRLWRLHAGLGLLGVLAGGVAVAVAATRVDYGLPSLAAIVEACRRWTLTDAGVESALLLLVGSLGTAMLLRTLRSTARQLAAGRRFSRRLVTCGALPGVRRGLVLDTGTPDAFCLGLVRPRVYVSRGALAILRPEEVEAVVAHERHHAHRRDPLRILAARALADGLFPMPVMRRLSERYAALAELDADDAAVRATGGPQALASALLAFEAHPGPTAVGIAPERVDRLLGASARWELPTLMMAGGLATGVVLLALSARLAGAMGHASVALPAVLADVCMVAMAGLPLLAGAGLLLGGRAAVQRVARRPDSPS